MKYEKNCLAGQIMSKPDRQAHDTSALTPTTPLLPFYGKSHKEVVNNMVKGMNATDNEIGAFNKLDNVQGSLAVAGSGNSITAIINGDGLLYAAVLQKMDTIIELLKNGQLWNRTT